MNRKLAALCFVIGLLGNTSYSDELPPGVVDTQDPADVPLTPAESLQRITVPDGFHVSLFAGEPDVRRPIAFDFDDRGRLWVVENYSHPQWQPGEGSDRVLIFEDLDHDGVFDQRTVFWDRGRYLTGIAIGHGGIWICNTPELAFIPDRDRNDVPDSEPIVMLDGFRESTSNVLNNLHWGPDGWLYGAIGLSAISEVGIPGSVDRTKITRGLWRFHPTRHTFEVVAEGMVNPWGADFNEYGDLFTTNTVIAHLWHIVPGMYCQRRGTEQDYPYAYGRIQSITDHLHWGGGMWQASRTDEERHSVAGGGHAHCGAMIYLGDNWPDDYRGTFFTANLHGNRVNNDRLVPAGSTYVGVHADDFLFGNDPWFRGMSVKYGADGGVYVSDWHDLGECHDNDGSHRSSGRIFKVVYGQSQGWTGDLQAMSDLDLVELLQHPNEWFARHARRILQERAAGGSELTAAREWLRATFEQERDEVQQLRLLWTQFVIDDLGQDELVRLLDHDSLHVRRWSIRMLVDADYPGAAALEGMARLAREDVSPQVRLALASSLQRLELDDRWQIARALLEHAEDAHDAYLPLMIWYGVEPLVSEQIVPALQLATASNVPLVRQFIARRALDCEDPPIDEVLQVVLDTSRDETRLDLLRGIFEAYDGRGSQSAPESWEKLYRQLTSSSLPAVRSTAARLAILFGDASAIEQLRRKMLSSQTIESDRRDAFYALLNLDDGIDVSLLHELAAERTPLRRDAIQALTLRNQPSTAELLIELYPDLNDAERQDVISVLVTRQDFAARLLQAIQDRRLDRDDVSAFALQQLRAFSDGEIRRQVQSLWSGADTQLKKSDEIARFKKLLTAETLERGNEDAGRQLFDRTCAKCHTLFGQGGRLGPDLTGSGRKSIDYLLSNLIDPSAIVDPAYRLTRVLMNDGRILSGFMVQHAERFVMLRTPEAEVRLALDDIDELQTTSTSMMPEGMLGSYDDEQVRDLIRFLSSN